VIEDVTSDPTLYFIPRHPGLECIWSDDVIVIRYPNDRTYASIANSIRNHHSVIEHL
jgi:hypothetical protein